MNYLMICCNQTYQLILHLGQSTKCPELMRKTIHRCRMAKCTLWRISRQWKAEMSKLPFHLEKFIFLNFSSLIWNWKLRNLNYREETKQSWRNTKKHFAFRQPNSSFCSTKRLNTNKTQHQESKSHKWVSDNWDSSWNEFWKSRSKAEPIKQVEIWR